MAEMFALQSSENNQNRRQPPANFDNDRYTPNPYENPNNQRFKPSSPPPMKDSYATPRTGPEVYHLNNSKNNSQPMHDDDQPYSPSSHPIKNSHSNPRTGPELYHLNNNRNDDQPYRSSSPPIKSTYSNPPTEPEVYQLPMTNDTPSRRPSPAFGSTNRVSPVPQQTSRKQGAEMYHIEMGNETRRSSATRKTTTFNDQPIYHNNQDPLPPGQVTVYTISAVNGENIPSTSLRTPSPPIRQTKKKQSQPPFSYDTVDDENKYQASPIDQRVFPTALHDVPTNIRYVPLTQSKASESIARSMNKYRFAGS